MHSLITCLADEKSKKSNYIKDFKREYVITSQNLNMDDRDIDREHIGFDRPIKSYMFSIYVSIIHIQVLTCYYIFSFEVFYVVRFF